MTSYRYPATSGWFWLMCSQRSGVSRMGTPDYDRALCIGCSNFGTGRPGSRRSLTTGRRVAARGPALLLWPSQIAQARSSPCPEGVAEERCGAQPQPLKRGGFLPLLHLQTHLCQWRWVSHQYPFTEVSYDTTPCRPKHSHGRGWCSPDEHHRIPSVQYTAWADSFKGVLEIFHESFMNLP